MDVITQEHLATNFIQSILTVLRKEYIQQENNLSFDEWLYKNLTMLGDVTYTAIGDYFGGEIVP